jgi:hypothetical protein
LFVWIDMALGDAGTVPERLRNAERIDPGCLPLGLFVADAVHLAVVHAAERDGELITGLASERARLRVAQVMGVGWLAAADQARLPGNVAQMFFVAVAPRL